MLLNSNELLKASHRINSTSIDKVMSEFNKKIEQYMSAKDMSSIITINTVIHDLPYLTDIEVKFLSNIAHQQGWILTVIPDNNQTITYQLKISDHSNNNYQPVVNSNTSPTSNLNILMQEYIICIQLDTYKLSKAAKAVNEHKISALSSAIYAFLLSGVQPDNKYANMFNVNNASEFWSKLICE